MKELAKKNKNKLKDMAFENEKADAIETIMLKEKLAARSKHKKETSDNMLYSHKNPDKEF